MSQVELSLASEISIGVDGPPYAFSQGGDIHIEGCLAQRAQKHGVSLPILGPDSRTWGDEDHKIEHSMLGACFRD